MTRQLQADRLNIKAFAQDGETLSLDTPLQKMERLAQETQGLQPESRVQWKAVAELRERTGPEADIWLHLTAKTVVPLTCQRCMLPLLTPLEVDRWYRFVASEDIAMAEDDQSEEDLLVMEPQFDVVSLLEDELLMALPLVPMHDVCPTAAHASLEGPAAPDLPSEKLNPFAVLSQLKKK